MLRRMTMLLVMLGTACLIGGCSDSSDPGLTETDQPYSGVVQGEISGEPADFEFSVAIGKEAGDPASDTVLLRGRNVAYDDENGALTVDLTLVNDGDKTYPEPVGLTFLKLLPPEVTVLDADNGESGPGAAYEFEFENDDAMWTPGEESLPRNAKFVVAAGTSIGFMARIDMATSPDGGNIGGMVWHDENENGEMDEGEDGVGGIDIALRTDEETVTPLQTATTAEDGTYRFDGLDAGYYTVTRVASDDLTGTTPAEMAVILVENEGTVSDFLMADFGVVRGDGGGGEEVRVGDYVQAKGWHEIDPHRLVAEIFNVCHCDDADKHDDDDDDDGDDEDCDDCDEDCEDGCRENDCWGLLAGPITGFDREERVVEIMGTPVHFTEKCDWDEIEHGIRMRVKVAMDGDDVVACGRPKWWNGNRDRVSGFVQEIIRGDGDRIIGVMVLNTLVMIEDVEIHEPGYIGGFVFDDLDGNGEMDDGEPGIPGVEVELSGAASATFTSDVSGAFAFGDLAMGAYTVECGDVDGYEPTTLTTLQITLANGEIVDSADFGWMEDVAEPTGIIKGKVWNDLNGDGMMNDDEPGLEGATLTLAGDAGGTTTTSSDGSYAFTELAAGTYEVTSIGPEGWVATTATAVQAILVADDAVFDEASFGWREPVIETGSISGVVFEDTNGNKIQDEGEPGIAGVGVTLGGAGTGTATTEEGGGYLFVDLVTGDYAVTCDDVDGFDSTTGTTLEIKVEPGEDIVDAVFGWWAPALGAN